jgi:deoxyribodipyrimidine photolyase-related protein
MRSIRLILWDQLSASISSLQGYDPEKDIIFMCEVMSEATYVKHHKKKLAFLFAAMRHFAESLREKGYKVAYTRLDDADNAGALGCEVRRLCNRYNCNHLVVTYPGEYRILEDIRSWESRFSIIVEIREDDRFLCTLDTFFSWAKDRSNVRMECFYREMRKQHGILMDGNDPVGGKWNYDAENRKPPKGELNIPAPYVGKIDRITQEVIDLVATRFTDHFGDLHPFYFAVTREDALQALDQFIVQRLNHFGDYQDAMLEGEPWMYHAHIGFYLNCGLLLPLECIQAVEKAYYQGTASLNAVEGFIRQIMGWREYIRGIYWHKMPEYKNKNFLDAKRNLPAFFWKANSKLNCMNQCIKETQAHAYAHHIQRLMVLGNFALLTGIDPAQVNEWYLIVYADAHEWVELPNVMGMILFADGGYLASKPYAAGGAYINKMSNYCKNCAYNVSISNGPQACPFNYLYWDFLARNKNKLGQNHRLSMMYKLYDRMDLERKNAIESDSIKFLNTIEHA